MFQSSDAPHAKIFAIFAYILFFLPLIGARNSRFAMYHSNQGLVLMLTFMACNMMLGLVPFIGWLLIPIANLGIVFLIFVGMLNAAGGVMRPLPVIGKINIL